MSVTRLILPTGGSYRILTELSPPPDVFRGLRLRIVWRGERSPCHAGSPHRFTLVTVLASGSAWPASAQTAPAVPQHKHYDTPPGYDQAPAPGMPLAPRLQNLGVHTFPVSTKDSRAQLFINQGLNLVYGFNHAEAARAFAEAARLDPSLAMAYWGQALVLGPNINARDGPGSRAQGARPGAEGRGDEGVRHPARAGLHRRARGALHGQGRRPQGGRPRLRRRDGARRRGSSPTTSTRGRSTPRR